MARPTLAPSHVKRLVEIPPNVSVADQVRGSLLHSSLMALERLGLSDTYYARLGEADARTMREIVVGEWVPMSLALAHYGAIDSLGISASQAKQNGRLVAERIQIGFAGIVFRSLGAAVTPLDALTRTPVFFSRLIHGGGVGVEQRGPKDARVEIVSIPMGRFEYVREGWAGMFEATLGALSYKTFARNSSPRGSDTVILDLSWI